MAIYVNTEMAAESSTRIWECVKTKRTTAGLQGLLRVIKQGMPQSVQRCRKRLSPSSWNRRDCGTMAQHESRDCHLRHNDHMTVETVEDDGHYGLHDHVIVETLEKDNNKGGRTGYIRGRKLPRYTPFLS
jgi:hypothetical protein